MEGTVRTAESSAPPEDLFAVAADLESYPEWADGVKEVEVLEIDGAGRAAAARFVVEAMVREIEYVLEYTYDPPTSIKWSARPGGDIEAMEGSYTFTAREGDTTEVVYALAVKPSFKVPGFLRSQAERHIVTTALRSLRRRAESA
jgi:uncharacterized membrane protein